MIVALAEQDEPQRRPARLLTDELRELNSVHAGHLIGHQAKIEARPIPGAQRRQCGRAAFSGDHLHAP